MLLLSEPMYQFTHRSILLFFCLVLPVKKKGTCEQKSLQRTPWHIVNEIPYLPFPMSALLHVFVFIVCMDFWFAGLMRSTYTWSISTKVYRRENGFHNQQNLSVYDRHIRVIKRVYLWRGVFHCSYFGK